MTNRKKALSWDLGWGLANNLDFKVSAKLHDDSVASVAQAIVRRLDDELDIAVRLALKEGILGSD